MEKENKASDPGVKRTEDPAPPVQSSGAESDKREIPIARNANPAGISTARTVADLPMEVAQRQNEVVTGTTSAAGSELSKTEYPIARNANPTGVSTARTRE